MAGIATIHDTLSHVDSGAGKVGAPTHVGHFGYRSTVNPHSHRNFRMLLQSFGYFQATTDRLSHAVPKHQCHAVTGWELDQLLVRCLTHLRCLQNDFRQAMQSLLLLFDQQLRIANQVEKKDVPDF